MPPEDPCGGSSGPSLLLSADFLSFLDILASTSINKIPFFMI